MKRIASESLDLRSSDAKEHERDGPEDYKREETLVDSENNQSVEKQGTLLPELLQKKPKVELDDVMSSPRDNEADHDDRPTSQDSPEQ